MQIIRDTNKKDSWSHFEDLALTRSFHLLRRVLEGFNLTLQEGFDILNRHKDVKDEDKLAVLLQVALDNAIEFSIYEEFRVFTSLPDKLQMKDMESYMNTFRTYNYRYAKQENEDFLYASKIACWWLGIGEEEIITFNTQRDERVRDLHQSFDGLYYPKSQFPVELIPPIEFECRCYLTSSGYTSLVEGAIKSEPELKKINPIFRESLAAGGRIITDAHPYFNVTPKQKEKLQRVKKSIMKKYMDYVQRNNL